MGSAREAEAQSKSLGLCTGDTALAIIIIRPLVTDGFSSALVMTSIFMFLSGVHVVGLATRPTLDRANSSNRHHVPASLRPVIG